MTRLSLCIIARNEETRLARAISSMGTLPDEIVVLDTGSTDGTVALAQQLGAKVVEWPWREDFAAARNEVFSHAQGEWIFLLDADECLHPNQESELERILNDPGIQGAYVVREDLVSDDPSAPFAEILQLRLFRRELLPQQVGRCHARFVPPLQEIAQAQCRTVVCSAIRMSHDGYLGERWQDKVSRGRRLVELELQDRPGQLYYLAELLRIYGHLELPTDSVFQDAWQAMESQMESGAVEPNAQHVLEWALVHHLKPMDECAAICDRFLDDVLPLRWQLARASFEVGNFQEAIRQLQALDVLISTDRYSRAVAFDPRIMEPDYLLNGAVAYAQLGDIPAAIAWLERVADHPRWGDLAKRNLATLRGLHSN